MITGWCIPDYLFYYRKSSGCLLPVGNFTNHPTGIAGSNDIFRDIFGNNGSRTNHRIFTNGYARIYHRMSTDPHVIANGDRLGKFPTRYPWFGMYRMPGCKKRNIRSYHHVFAYRNVSTIENDSIVILMEVIA